MRTTAEGIFSSPSAEVVEWQTRTFEGRVAQAVRVQVPPSAPNSWLLNLESRYGSRQPEIASGLDDIKPSPVQLLLVFISPDRN